MKFMKSVVSRVKAVSNATVYDLHNPNTIQTTNCEFLDGIHGGQTTYARILLNVKDSTIGQYLNQSKIRDDIYKFAGRTIDPDEIERFMTGKREVDFLNLNCKK